MSFFPSRAASLATCVLIATAVGLIPSGAARADGVSISLLSYSLPGAGSSNYTVTGGESSPDDSSIYSYSVSADIGGITPASQDGSSGSFSAPDWCDSGMATVTATDNFGGGSVTAQVFFEGDPARCSSGGGTDPFSFTAEVNNIGYGGGVAYTVSGGNLVYSVSIDNPEHGTLSSQTGSGGFTAPDTCEGGVAYLTATDVISNESITVSIAFGGDSERCGGPGDGGSGGGDPLTISANRTDIYVGDQVIVRASGGMSSQYSWSVSGPSFSASICNSSGANCAQNGYVGSDGVFTSWDDGSFQISVTDGVQTQSVYVTVQHRPLLASFEVNSLYLSDANAATVNFTVTGDVNLTLILQLFAPDGSRTLISYPTTSGDGQYTSSFQPGGSDGHAQLGTYTLTVSDNALRSTTNAYLEVTQDPGYGGGGPVNSINISTGTIPSNALPAGQAVIVTLSGGNGQYNTPNDDPVLGTWSANSDGTFTLNTVECNGGSATVNASDSAGNTGQEVFTVLAGDPDSCADPSPSPSPTPTQTEHQNLGACGGAGVPADPNNPDNSTNTMYSMGLSSGINPDYATHYMEDRNAAPGVPTPFDTIDVSASFCTDPNDDSAPQVPSSVTATFKVGSTTLQTVTLNSVGGGDSGSGNFKATLEGGANPWFSMPDDQIAQVIQNGSMTMTVDGGAFGTQSIDIAVSGCAHIWAPVTPQYDPNTNQQIVNKMVFMRTESIGWQAAKILDQGKQTFMHLVSTVYPYTEDKNLMDFWVDLGAMPQAKQDELQAADNRSLAGYGGKQAAQNCGVDMKRDALIIYADYPQSVHGAYAYSGLFKRYVWIRGNEIFQGYPVNAPTENVVEHELGHGIGGLSDEYEKHDGVPSAQASQWDFYFGPQLTYLNGTPAFGNDSKLGVGINCWFDPRTWIGSNGTKYGSQGWVGCGGSFPDDVRPDALPPLHRPSFDSIMNHRVTYPKFNVISCAAMRAGLRHAYDFFEADADWEHMDPNVTHEIKAEILRVTMPYADSCMVKGQVYRPDRSRFQNTFSSKPGPRF